MNEIIKVTNEEIVTLDSREVAEMLGKDHSMLLREIDGSKDGKTVGIIPTLEKANFAVSNYFIKSTYKSGTRDYKCYGITKMGCELIGNKQQGEKGIIFTAKYVEKFNKMEQSVKEHKPSCIEDVLISSLQEMKAIKQQLNQINFNALRASKLAIETQGEVSEVKEDLTQFKDDIPLFTAECEEVSRTVKRVGTKVLGGKGSKAYNDKSLRAKVYSDIHRQLKREFDVNSYKAIKRRYLSNAIDIVENYNLTIALNEQINMLNNQVAWA